MEDFNFFFQKDREDLSYQACIGGSVLVGAAVGRFGMLPGLVAGAATGLAVGLLTCRRLSPAVERKIFSSNDRLTELELASVLRVLQGITSVQTKSDAMYLFGQARTVAIAEGEGLRNSRLACVPPRIAATQLLSRRSNGA